MLDDLVIVACNGHEGLPLHDTGLCFHRRDLSFPFIVSKPFFSSSRRTDVRPFSRRGCRDRSDRDRIGLLYSLCQLGRGSLGGDRDDTQRLRWFLRHVLNRFHRSLSLRSSWKTTHPFPQDLEDLPDHTGVVIEERKPQVQIRCGRVAVLQGAQVLHDRREQGQQPDIRVGERDARAGVEEGGHGLGVAQVEARRGAQGAGLTGQRVDGVALQQIPSHGHGLGPVVQREGRPGDAVQDMRRTVARGLGQVQVAPLLGLQR